MSDLRLYIALYVDEDVRKRVVVQLRQHGYDVEYALEPTIAHEGWDDEQHLMYAASHNRVLLTHNADDFNRLYQTWWELGRPHAGIVVAPQWETGVLVKRLLNFLNTVTADEMVNNYRHLGEFG